MKRNLLSICLIIALIPLGVTKSKANVGDAILAIGGALLIVDSVAKEQKRKINVLIVNFKSLFINKILN